MTRRLAEAVIQTGRRSPTLHVAQLFGLHWDSVRLLERRALQTELDEFALLQGHRYTSVVQDADSAGSAKDVDGPLSDSSSKSWGP
ncbi:MULTISPECIES: hypothetical protein [unclassified Pseudomonas]|nr:MULTISPECIES: hypothetical protein [unclassified Pseudomonas]